MIVFQSNVIEVNKKTFTWYVGVAKIFDWGGRPNCKLHVMTSSNFRKEEIFAGQRYRRMEDQKPGPGLACNLGFAKEKGLERKSKKISKIVQVGRRGQPTTVA